MARKYTKVEQFAEIVKERHNQGKIYGEISDNLGLKKNQLKRLRGRQRRKGRMLAAGYIPQPKEHPRKEPANEEAKQHNEIVKLQMQVELPRNFLSETGRRRS